MTRAILFLTFITGIFIVGCIIAPAISFMLVASLIGLYSGSEYWLRVFLTFDQGINVVFYRQLNYIFDYPSYSFGDEDETISSVIGKNLKIPNTRTTAEAMLICDKWLTAIDPSDSSSHSEEAIELDENVL